MKNFQVDPSEGEFIVEFYLLLAQNLVRNGNEQEAERWILRALTSAEIIAGYESPLTARVLMELFDLYDTQNRQEEAKIQWDRLSDIVRRHCSRYYQ